MKHPIKELIRRIKWGRVPKESRKILREEADKLIGWDKRINPEWKDYWKYFIKREYPFGGFI